MTSSQETVPGAPVTGVPVPGAPVHALARLLVFETFFGLPRIITGLVRLLSLRRKTGDDDPEAEANRREAVPGYRCTNALQ